MQSIKRKYWILLTLFVSIFELQGKIVFSIPNIENLHIDYAVRSIVKDHDGFIWIGTDNSLSRFDGYKSIHFSHSPDDSTTVSSKNISCILPDNRGNLWIGTMGGGLNLFIKETNSFKRFTSEVNNTQSISHNWVNKIFSDSNNRLWICTQNGLNLYNYSTRTFTRFFFNSQKIVEPIALTKSSLLDIDEDKSGNLWLTTIDGLHKFNPSTKKHTKFSLSLFKSMSELKNICIDDNNIIWISSHRGPLFKVIPENFSDTTHLEIKSIYKNTLSPDGLPDDRTSKIIQDKGDYLWIATENGLSRYNKVTEKIQNYFHIPGMEQSLPSNIITELYSDNQGILWIGTLNNGVALFDPNNNRFPKHFSEINTTNLPNLKFVKSIFKDKSNTYWIGTDYGLLEYSATKNLINKYAHNSNNQKSIGRGGVTGFVVDNKGRNWVSNWGGGLALFDQKSGIFNRMPFNPDSTLSPNFIGDNNIRAMIKDLDGNLWLGTTKGFLDEFNPLTFKFKHHFVFDKDSLRGVPIRSLAVDKTNNIWITTTPQGRLLKFDRKSGKIIHFSDKNFANNGLGAVEAISLFVDKTNTVWIGCNNGLYKYNSSENSFSNYSFQNRLPLVPIRFVIGDNNKTVWMSSANQLIEHNTESKKTRIFNHNDGLFPMATYGFMTIDGELLLGGKNGINSFKPSELSVNEISPPIVLTELRINDLLQTTQTQNTPLINEINSTQTLKLKYSQSTFSISYSALNYSQTSKNQYAFMLEGLENTWNYVGNRRTAFYTNLRPGKYIFKVKGSNNDGVWSPEIKSLVIVIAPPWYSSKWAYIIYFTIIVFIILIILNFINERQKLKHSIEIQRMNYEIQHAIDKKEKELNDSKLQFFSNISHEIRTPLTLILSPLYDVIQNEKLSTSIKKSLTISHINAKRLHKLVNQLLDLSKVESGFMRLEVCEGNIADSIRTIIDSLDLKAKKKEVELKLTMNQYQAQGFYDLDKLEKILTNIVDNAIKHAPGKSRVNVNVTFSGSKVEDNFGTNSGFVSSVTIKVSDKGKGINQEIINKIFEKFYQAKGEQGAGIGLFLAKSLTEIHGGSITVVSNPYIETIFEIKLPLSKSDFSNDVILDANYFEEQVKLEDIDYKKEVKDNNTSHTKGLPIVLIIEDEEDLRNYITTLFAKFRVLTASNGKEGLVIARETIPDIIICDVMMPEMDGFELTKEIKTFETTSHIPVILLTAKNTNEDQLKGLQLGAIDYITKPFSSNSLLLKVNNQIRNQREHGKQFINDPDGNLQKLKFNSTDQKFINKLNEIIETNYSDPEFDYGLICSEMGMSRAQLYRKVSALTNKTVSEYIRIFRLKKAAQMLIDEGLNISEILYNVGFNNHSYFTKCFKEFFGVLPSEYLKN